MSVAYCYRFEMAFYDERKESVGKMSTWVVELPQTTLCFCLVIRGNVN